MFGGKYRLVVRRGVLSPSAVAGVFEFRCETSDDLLAYFAPADVWVSAVPQPWSARILAAPGADVFDLPIFLLEDVPFLRARESAHLEAGLVAPAKVPVDLITRSRQSAFARQRSRSMRKGSVTTSGGVY